MEAVKRIMETSVVIDDALRRNPGDIGFVDAQAEIERIMAPLKPHERRNVANQLRRQYTAELSRYEKSIADKKARIEVLENQKSAIASIQEWAELPPRIERNDCSRFHRLATAAKAGAILALGEEGESETLKSYENITEHYSHVFVVKHDWAGGFGEAIGNAIPEDWRLPYDLCAFEFVISRMPVIVLAVQNGTISKAVAFIETNGCWATLGSVNSNKNPQLLFAWEQVRAICIALDSEVAISTVERAPIKLNEKRLKAGKVPLCDYHIVDLARRHRVHACEVSTGGGHKRLHFRRGHWRHYEDHKTWIKWTLVGNPHLGFVSTEYSL